MKNITVTVDDDTYRRARVKAAENDTSISATVRDFLIQFAAGETDWERRKRLERETLATISGFRGSIRLSRKAVHERAAAHD